MERAVFAAIIAGIFRSSGLAIFMALGTEKRKLFCLRLGAKVLEKKNGGIFLTDRGLS